ncbi:MAG: 7-cyano-7-deazaguanine synthase QueC [Magnetococcales bacterium]|nr:7-cyano-7-deazaguanine synthase QueC [Magnetococcales bacterium]MBF0150202.1 7-cyano-7-deazaguanine synthase QueC [Magnetococcales bacterium]MBF0174786.1 7-cyano-7-deazaguanine synthase QueC [Magnetococcales bacterium]MBF0347910.1 7-cyano-7-deazaguanine synthase QueC [Magnetococcales bacterium]MBF0631904.1 7-cyano-7-deazaguanine synthase QueC [Magnetococcales bacterium]
MDPTKALVLFSGGQDSTTCLAWALEHHSLVETVGFDYGQRHAVELSCRNPILTRLRECFPQWAPRLGADHLIDLHTLGQISDTALTRDVEIRLSDGGLPNTFVPGRNLVFLTMAAALAYRRGITVLVGGMCETDYSGYPDCRDDAIKALQVCLNIGMASRLRIETPLMWRDKGAVWQLAETLGGHELVDLIRTHTHTCYVGERTRMHAWGHGCAACPACKLRADGYQKYLSRI